MQKKTNNIVLCIYVLMVGIIVGAFLSNFYSYKFDSSVEVFDVISLFVTSYIGFYIASSVQESQSSSRAQKDFFLKELQDTMKYLELLKGYNSLKQYPFSDTKRTFKDFNQKLRLINKLLINSKSCKNVSVPAAVFARLTKLRSTITNKRVVANEIAVTSGEAVKIDTEIKFLNDSLYQLILEIVT